MQAPTLDRGITFADETQNPNTDNAIQVRLPRHLSPEEHIAFLENQRNPKDKGALRIPGPREFELGSVPERLNEEVHGGHLIHHATSPIEEKGRFLGTAMTRHATNDVPEHPCSHSVTRAFPNLSTQKSGTPEDTSRGATENKEHISTHMKAQTGTFPGHKGWAVKETERAAPYLSWQPTIGRNSAFIDLTEEQREELGGIEYRSLKTLALVLVCESVLRIQTCFLRFAYEPLRSILYYLSRPRYNHLAPMDRTHRHMGKHCG